MKQMVLQMQSYLSTTCIRDAWLGQDAGLGEVCVR
jgi:hypothetical protein